MKVDWYTKSILTVIAVCLAALVIRDIVNIPVVEAATDRGENVVKVQIVSIDESPSLAWEALPVREE